MWGPATTTRGRGPRTATNVVIETQFWAGEIKKLACPGFPPGARGGTPEKASSWVAIIVRAAAHCVTLPAAPRPTPPGNACSILLLPFGRGFLQLRLTGVYFPPSLVASMTRQRAPPMTYPLFKSTTRGGSQISYLSVGGCNSRTGRGGSEVPIRMWLTEVGAWEMSGPGFHTHATVCILLPGAVFPS